mmetsp:Transcript_31199/g.70188  ORF Transcript_31199/g.70188 Transcript_31199/m.70188 type:complete len:323 (+) Transcript_31199:40-1008(+)|eukprot:CAMPEP_0204360386 /NCGR_PEP_ID=MMETSP0469-20131031/37993_1 /ASSEMBLY_ACC=CAM_ASM_000384 /TAXON_ID=2969 /ORGANISM="Oxyrrhis marina" /LENGTH=322 /DNA_ID=CAMNT_0051348587 /DNA_START=29 /DNA_END=997 /DNA_ORIENTATION=+
MKLGLLVAVVAGDPDMQCSDPLFQTHWFGKNDIATFSKFPTVISDLKLCPAFNNKASCCRQDFETEQLKYFNFWRQIFASKIARVQKHRASVQDVRNTPGFQPADSVDKEQFEAALQAFGPVLSPAVHADCFSSMLTYAAGMICFGCNPDWFNYAVRDSKHQVIKVQISSGCCVELWTRCEAFGAASVELRQRVLDSTLAKQAKLSMENLDIFQDQQTLCDGLHNMVALHPFTTPTEADKEAAPAARLISRRLFELNETMGVMRQLEDLDSSVARTKSFDAIRMGKASGFDLSWTGGGDMPGAAAGVGLSALLVGATLRLGL